MEWDVVEALPEPPLAVKVRFADGTQGRVRFEPSHLTGVFERLRDAEVFNQVKIEDGALTWPGEVDLAPDAMYDAIKSHGEWVLR